MVFKFDIFIIVVDNSIRILRRQVRIHVCRLSRIMIYNIATINTLQTAREVKVVIVTLIAFVLLWILLMLIRLLQNFIKL